MVRSRAGLVFLWAGLASGGADAAYRFVSVLGGFDSSNNCVSVALPCATISYGMARAAPGDTVLVAPGTYAATTGEMFPITLKSGVRLIADDDEHGTIIDAAGASARVFLVPASDDKTELSGFVIGNGLALSADGVSEGGAMLVNGSIRISRNLFIANVAQGYFGGRFGGAGGPARGGAISIMGGNPTLDSNVFRGNYAYGGRGGSSVLTDLGGPGGEATGGAIYAGGALAVLVNNTFYDNHATGGNGGTGLAGSGTGGAATAGAVWSGYCLLYSNLLAWNGAQGGGGSTVGTAAYGAAWMGAFAVGGLLQPSSNNLFWSNVPEPQAENLASLPILADPRFHTHNLRIMPYSPARNAGWISQTTGTGVSLTDFDDVGRPTPTSVGAFEPSGNLPTTDLNADGTSDILWRNAATGEIYRLLMSGFTITGAASVYNEPNLAWKIVGDADFNGDGTSDLLWRNTSTGAVWMTLMRPDGTPAFGAQCANEPNQAWKIVATPDLDGDERADILWWNASTGQVWAMLMDGPIIKAQGLVYTEPDTAWRIAATGDFFGDGRHGLLWRNSSTGQVFLLRVTYRTGVFYPGGAIIHTEPNLAWKIVAAADFNGDGVTDILWRNESTGQIYMMLMNGTTIAQAAPVYTEPNTAWKIVAVGDYDGDRKADLLWRNDVTGQVYMMLMNGLAIAGQGLMYQESNTAWKILGPWEYAQ